MRLGRRQGGTLRPDEGKPMETSNMTDTYGKKTVVVDRKTGNKMLVMAELTIDWDTLTWRLARKARTNRDKTSRMDIGIKLRIVREEPL